MANAQVCDRFSSHIALVEQLERRTHLLQHIQDSGAGGVDAHVFNRELGAGHHQRGDQPKRGGTDVAGHHHVLSVQLRPRLHDHRGPFSGLRLTDQISAKGAQHAFAVVARERWFDHGGAATGG